jgi:hypothetical protein
MEKIQISRPLFLSRSDDQLKTSKPAPWMKRDAINLELAAGGVVQGEGETYPPPGGRV